MTDLSALIEALESAEEGSRELDYQIAGAVGWEVKHDDREPQRLYWRLGDMIWTATGAEHPPPYSSSLDAALTLVPEGAEWGIDQWKDSATADVSLAGDWNPPDGDTEAATPPLALCSAILKAKEADHDT